MAQAPSKTHHPHWLELARWVTKTGCSRINSRKGGFGNGRQGLAPDCIDCRRADLHLRHLSIGHRMAFGVDVGPRPFSLSADDRGRLRHAWRVPLDRFTRSAGPSQLDLVYRVVERGARADHGRAI